jgi:outer membrane murein-binding lipoprotein Lpp
MLSEAQQQRVWEGMLSAEIRANYFADFAGRFYSRQRWATWASLVFSSVALVSLLASLPEQYVWIRPALVLPTALLSAYSVAMQNQKFAADSADLHARWNRLAKDYEAIWEDIYADDALECLNALEDRTTDLSKAGAFFKYDKSRILKWEKYVVAHRLAHAS